MQKTWQVGSLHYQSRILGKGNVIRWMDARGKLFFDANGETELVLNPMTMKGSLNCSSISIVKTNTQERGLNLPS